MFHYNSFTSDESRDNFHLKCLSRVVSHYQWLIDAYIVDYFDCDHWSRVPKTWAESVDQFSLKDIQSFLCSESNPSKKSVLPLSLLSFRATCFALQLSRNSTPNSELDILGSKFSLKDNLLESELKGTKNPRMKFEILSRHIKHKKRHEMARLCPLIDHVLSRMDDCTTVVDCGSGQGHLSRLLSLCFGYNVISIEGNDQNVSGAQNKDFNILKSLKRYNLTDSINTEFPKKVNQMLGQNCSISDITDTNDNHMLLGLHACGPLSTIIVKQLTSCSETKAIALISCCYMKTDIKSFPMSATVKRLLPDGLSYAAKEIACHAIDKFVDKLSKNEDLDSLKVHCFRAILESLIGKYNPNMKHKPLRRVRIDQKMTFKEYCLKASHGLNIGIPDEELDSSFVTKCLNDQKKVLIFYSLRLVIAPLVETLILLDFVSYLRERGIRTAVYPVFDPIVSPRNNVLIAIK